MNKFKRRCIIMIAITACLGVVFAWRLFSLQIIQGSSFALIAQKKYVTDIVEEAPRGEIYDCYGRPLVTNKVVYALQFQKFNFDYEEENEILLDILRILKDKEYAKIDTLPISGFAPYVFAFGAETVDENLAKEEKWKAKNNFKKETTAQEVMDFYVKKYKISEEYSQEEIRDLIGIRYQMKVEEFSTAVPYEIARDVDMDVVTKIKENESQYPNILVVNKYVREYANPEFMAHILGRVGLIYQEEYAELKDAGYEFNDYIGKQGLEKALESDLRGKDGVKRIVKNKYGEIISSKVMKDPVPGNYAILTIDLEMQKLLEKSLKEAIEDIKAKGLMDAKEKNGADCNAGAAVVIDVNTGAILAQASYPSYNLETFSPDYADLLKNKDKPLINRALQGTYEPGSVFKMVTAAGALEEGLITDKDKIRDLGVYKFYKDYQPRCWVYTKTGSTHGNINVSDALKHSCNYFFYDVGRRLEINNIYNYSKKFGLGEYTGSELAFEEAKGNVTGPTVDNIGDALQAAIGQSRTLLTPLQLTNYIATLANGGTLYTPHYLKGIRSAEDGKIVRLVTPVIRDSVNFADTTLDPIKKGMLSVTQQGGTAYSVFADFDIPVAGKTGSAQVPNGSDNGIFAAFAPYDNPQIAVVTVIEHGTSGNTIAPITRKIFEYHFSKSNIQPDFNESNQLLP